MKKQKISYIDVVVRDMIPDGAAVDVQFAVTATTTITNSMYYVVASEAMTATGGSVVVTRIGSYAVYLPLVIREL